MGRTKGRTTSGVDCVGVFLGPCEAFGLVDTEGIPITLRDYATYTRDVNALAELRTRLLEKKFSELRPADVIVFNFPIAGLPGAARGDARQSPCHVAIAGDLFGFTSVIQAYQGLERVTEHMLDAKWRRRIAGVFSIPGVVD